MRRFGAKGIKNPLNEAPAPKGAEMERNVNRAAATAELDRISSLIEQNWETMGWKQMWKWLHRIKVGEG